MKHPINSRRSRVGRNGGKRPFTHNTNRSLDSNGPGLRVRGTPNQIFDKYLALARDATVSGDRVSAENLFQHAEHYFRILNGSADGQIKATPQIPAAVEGEFPKIADADAVVESETTNTDVVDGEPSLT